jgi:hypothetical protein
MQIEPPATNEQAGATHNPEHSAPMNTTPPPIPNSTNNPPVIPPLPVNRPAKSLRLMGILAAAMVGLLVVGLLGSGLLRSASKLVVLHANRDKVEMLAKLSALQHPHDGRVAQPLCTPKGYQVWSRAGGYLPSAKDGFEIVGFQSSGDFCDVAMVRNTVEGVVKLYVRLIRSGNEWRYDDVYFSEAGGRKIELWASYVQEHPVLASAKVLQPEIKAAYNEAKAALKGTAGTIHDVAAIASLLKGL